MEESWGLEDYSDGEPDFSVDPVCGQKLDEAKAHHKTGYAGVIYHFCSLDCQKKFEEEPGLYIGQEKRKHA
jgi:Cu+-exporting ATPase